MLVLRSLGKFAQPCIGHRGQLLARQRQQRAGQRSCVTASAAPTMVYRVEPLTKGERVIPAADVVLEAFSYDDEYSMSRALGASREGFPIWMRGMYMPACASFGPGSVIAVDDKGELGGVLTLEDLNEDIDEVAKQASAGGDDAGAAAEPELSEEAKKKAEERTAVMAPLIGILDACKVMFWKEYAKRGGNAADKELKPKGKFAYLGFLAVSGTHRRRQVGSVLVAASSEKLAAQGFEYSVAFCTSYRSKALFAKQGFEYWGGERYHTYQHNGRTWFESLPDDEIAVMVKRIAK